MEIFQMSEPMIWIGLAVIFAIIEAFTLGLATIWFAVGSVVACVAAWFGAPIFIQIGVFLVVSIVLLYFTRPLAQKKLKLGHTKDITEAIIGKTALVTKDIVPFQPGQAKANGLTWTAVSEDPEATVLEGSEVLIVKIEGVKLIVKAM